ncbi:TetR/AcrR family transcriptional regulator [Corallococcus sp. RDP092CA]|uniref:TetR/AcrR family transcriptional regulator n=1 Tax=Corallococcus sp. RDP092CA TaxID=3109369 RepID=UPI0035B33495
MARMEQTGVRTRRRGATLEDALLAAAWAELAKTGYTNFTFDAVAKRANTSRAVLYRRWSSKPKLVGAAIAREIQKDEVVTPDTGSLRGDVIALLTQANGRRVRLAITLLAHLGDYYRATGTSIATLRKSLYGDRESTMETIIERAVARGEVKPGVISDRIMRLPLDLFRQQLAMTYAPVPAEEIAGIVDTVFLPLLKAHGAL